MRGQVLPRDLTIAIAVWLALAAPAAAGATAPRTVLTVYRSSEDFPGTQALDTAIRQVLHSGPERVDYFTEYLESDRFSGDRASTTLRDFIRDKFQGRHIDVVIAITDVALQFVLRYRAELFADAPIVSSTVAAPDAALRTTGPGLTGVLNATGYGETLQLALKLHPATARVFYIAGAPDPVLRESMRAELGEAAHDVELTAIDETSIPRLVAAIQAVPRDSLILYLRYSQGDAGNVLFPSDIAPVVARAAMVPVYGVAESYLGSGIVGGVMSSRDLIGTRIGEMARAILRGTRPQDMPIEHPPPVPMFDWRQLRRWGIRDAALPVNSTILFEETTTWQRHKGTIIATIAVLALQSSLIAGLVLERRRRRRAEIESRHNLAALAHLDRRAAMGELATSLAHELNQPLNAILQNAGVAQMLIAGHALPPALGEMADIISDIRKDDIRASEMIRRMRGLLQKRELEAQAVNLNDVAEETIAIVRPDAKSRQVELDFDPAANMRPIVGDRVHLQQVLLNLVMNAMDAVATTSPDRRHVRVWTSQRDGEVRLAVVDSGTGIPPDHLKDIFEPFYTTKREGTGMGMGLAIARSIVEAHAGRMAAENNTTCGATVWFSIPIASAPPSEGHTPAH